MMHHMKERLFGPVEVPILDTVGRTEIAANNGVEERPGGRDRPYGDEVLRG